MREIIQRVAAHVQSPGRDFVPVRLPDVSAGALDQGDFGLSSPTEAVTQLGRQLETGRTASDDHDVMQ